MERAQYQMTILLLLFIIMEKREERGKDVGQKGYDKKRKPE